jgi:hypothetical protein
MITTNSGNGEEEQECNRFEHTIFLSRNQHRCVLYWMGKDGIPVVFCCGVWWAAREKEIT